MPHFSRAYWTVGLIQEQQGEFEESVAAFERAIQLSAQNPRMKAALARTLAGKKRPAGRMLSELKELAGSGMFSPFDIASIHFAPGERAEGVEWMGQAFRWTRGLIRCGGMQSLWNWRSSWGCEVGQAKLSGEGIEHLRLLSGIEMPEDQIADICRRYCIRELSVFGSAVRGEIGPESDVDVMVDLQPDAHLGWEFFDIAVELEGLLGRHVDLGTKDSRKAVARAAALREAVVVYAA